MDWATGVNVAELDGEARFEQRRGLERSPKSSAIGTKSVQNFEERLAASP